MDEQEIRRLKALVLIFGNSSFATGFLVHRIGPVTMRMGGCAHTA